MYVCIHMFLNHSLKILEAEFDFYILHLLCISRENVYRHFLNMKHYEQLLCVQYVVTQNLRS